MPARPPARAGAYLALVFTAALWGSNAVVARGLLDAVSPAQLAFARWAVVLAGLSPFAFAERLAIRDALRRHFRAYATFALLGFGPQTLIVYAGLAHTTALVLGVLNSAVPVLIVAIAALLHARRPRPLEMTGLAVSCIGVLTIVCRGRLGALVELGFAGGDLVILAGQVVWAFYTLQLAARPRELSLPSFIFVGALLGELAIAPFALADVALHGVASLRGADLAGIVYIGLLPSLAASLMYSFGVARVGAVKAGVFMHVVPVFAALLAISLLGERLHAFHVAGFVLVAGGALLCCLTPAPMLSSQAPRTGAAPS